MERIRQTMIRTTFCHVSKNYTRKNMISLLIFIIIIFASFIIIVFPGNGLASTSRARSALGGLPSDGRFNYVTLADVNKDDYLDIIVAAGGYPGNEPGGLYVYLNQNGKSFTDASTGLPGTGKNYFGSVQVIDIDKDSNLDIIAAYESGWSKGDNKGIGIWLGNGGSSWSAANSPTDSGSFDAAFCADINNDGKLDLVGGSSKGLHAWQGAHSGSSLSWTEVRTGLPTSNEYTGVKLGDVNNDGRLDIVAGSYSSQGISIYLCSSSGGISWSEGHSETGLKHNGNTFDMYLVDFNDDSNLDLVASLRGGVKVYLGNGNSGSRDSWWNEVSTGLPTSGDYYQIAVKDINNDDKLDIGCNFQVWSNTGSMSNSETYSWQELELDVTLSEAVGTAIGNLNNDDHIDIVGCGWDSGVKAVTLVLGVEQYHFIRGTVTDKATGGSLAGATVRTDKGDYKTKTNSNGEYELNVRDSSYQLTVILSGYKEALKLAEVSGSDLTVDFQLIEETDKPESKFTLSGTLTDSSNGEPISNVVVTLQPGGVSTTTNELGKYSLLITNGSYILSYSLSGYQSDSINVEINGDSIIKDFTLSSTSASGSDGDGSKDDGGLPFMEIPTIVFAVVIVILIFSRKRRK